MLLTIRGTPAWAGGGGKGLNGAEADARPAGLRLRAADRYSGKHVDTAGVTLPKVVRWEAWNEPNLGTNLMPQWTAIGTKKIVGDPFCFGKTWVPASPTIYRGILNAIYRGVHAAGTADGVTETVAGGATAPIGQGPCASVPGVAPLAFLRDAGQEARLARRLVAPPVPQPAASARSRTRATTSTCRACRACTRR